MKRRSGHCFYDSIQDAMSEGFEKYERSREYPDHWVMIRDVQQIRNGRHQRVRMLAFAKA